MLIPVPSVLLQQRLQIDQIVAGNEDRLAGNVAHAHRRRLRLAVECRYGPRPAAPGHDGDFAAFQIERQQLVHGDSLSASPSKAVDQEGLDGRIGPPETTGVIGVGRDALDAEQQQILQTGDMSGSQVPRRASTPTRCRLGVKFSHTGGSVQMRF